MKAIFTKSPHGRGKYLTAFSGFLRLSIFPENWALGCSPNRASIVSKLIGFYQPDIVAQEKISLPQSQSSEQLNKLFREIRKLAKQQGLAYGEYAPNTVRQQICHNGRATKKETAKIIVSLYPELAINLIQDRAWKEKYWGHMFDAVAVGLCCRRKLK